MLPSVVATQIRNCVADYLHTTFRPTTPGFDRLMDRFLAKSDNYYQGPYISIGLPFRPGKTGANFFKNIPLKFNLPPPPRTLISAAGTPLLSVHPGSHWYRFR